MATGQPRVLTVELNHMLQDNESAIVALGVSALVTALCYALLNHAAFKKKNIAPFPPGPKKVFVLGNALDLPRSRPWFTFAEWAKSYGPIVHLGVFGKDIIILNDFKYAKDMLDKKSQIYSNRPKLVMAGELVGWDESPGLIQFGRKEWSEYRRLIAQFLGTRLKVETTYSDLLEATTRSFLYGLLHTPDTWKEHGCRFTAAIVLKSTYGYPVKDEQDPLVKLAENAMNQFSELTGANAFAVDTFPFLRYVPQWFPRAGWKRKIGPYRIALQAMLDTPYNWVKEQMQVGSSVPCVVADLLDSHQYTNFEAERVLKWTAAGIYGGGAETTAAVIETFFLAMVLHPDAQRKAQAELDIVLGSCTVPRLPDRSRLPFVEALIWEVFRKYPIAPLGLPHSAAMDDIHDGFFIPKDAVIITNNWLFCRDPDTYSNPDLFQPERFIDTPTHAKEKDPKDILFGYGRRACPGIHLADMSLWLLFASILAFFDISAPVENGRLVFPSGRFLDGSISHPEEFKCTITARKGAAEVIRGLADT